MKLQINKVNLNQEYYQLLIILEKSFIKLNEYINKLNLSVSKNTFEEDLALQKKYINILKNKITEIKDFLVKSEDIEKEFVLDFTLSSISFCLGQSDKIYLLEKERLNLIVDEKEENIIQILEKQKKAIAKEILKLIRYYIFIVDKINEINYIKENNVAKRESFFIDFEECKTKCERNISVLQMQNQLQSEIITENLEYNLLRVDKIIQEFLLISSEKIKLIRKNSEIINVEIQGLIQSVNNFLADKSGNIDILLPLLLRDLNKFFPTLREEVENFMVSEDSNRIVTKVSDDDQYITEDFILSQFNDLLLIIRMIKSSIQNEFDKYTKMQLNSQNNYSLVIGNQQKLKELENLLKEQKWNDADKITTEIFGELVNKNLPKINFENLLKLPKDTLYFLDQLWLKYSKGKYGFSVQKSILTECEEFNNNYRNSVYKDFLKKIGRYKNQSFIGKISTIFQPENKKGYFPSIIVLNLYQGWGCVFDLLERE